MERDNRLSTLPSSIPPWKRSWLYWAPGQGSVLLWVIAVHAMAVVGLALAPPPSAELVVAMVFINLPGGLGLTLGYHRGLAHRSVRFHRWLEQLLLVLSMLNGFGSPSSWAAAHRIHHRYEDTERDVSSPIVGGFWWAHLRWLWQLDLIPVEQYPPSLRERRVLRWEGKQGPILLLVLILPMFLGATEWVWLGPVRLVYALHAQMLINSATHMGTPGDGRGGTSKNIGWLAIVQLGIGESWHRNHHCRPASARIGDKWWEIDLGWYLIRLLGALGLAYQIRASRDSHEPNQSLSVVRGKVGSAPHSSNPPS